LGYARHVRLSTRPDCMDDAVAEFLHVRGVRVVELGVQSMDDKVLRASARGHVSTDTVSASRAVKEAGMELGLQVMAGLPGDTPDGFMRTVERVIGLGPGFVRVYPVLVVRGAPLEALYRRGGYTPLGLDEAVQLCADAVLLFRAAGIKVVRTGLQPTAELEAAVLAGPYHPSFGHMVASELAFRRMLDAARTEAGHGPSSSVGFSVHPAELSEFLGIRKVNIDRLKDALGIADASIVADVSVPRGGLAITRM
ncbi:MAG TPA: radical SAM protein, partial [Nitrospirota bacterium]